MADRACVYVTLENLMLKHAARDMLIGLVMSGLSVGVAMAAEDDKVVATVNGVPILASEVEYAAEDLLAQIANVRADQRYRFLVSYLIERQLLAQAADKAKTAGTDEYKKRASFYRTKALRDAYFKTKIEPLVTEKDAKAYYEKETSQIKPQDEVRARNILLKTEEEAKLIAAEIKKGAKFEDLAKARSVGPNAPRGGDIGYFTKDKMVPEFASAAFKMKKGEVSGPIKSEFGWHLIKVEDRRQQKLQEFENIKAQIRNVLLRQRVAELATTLRKKAKIEYLDGDAKPPEPGAAPAAGKTPAPEKKK